MVVGDRGHAEFVHSIGDGGREFGRVPVAGYSRAVPAQSTPAEVGAVAIWTSADRPGLGDQLLGRVMEQELLARLPGWRMSRYAPHGWRRPSVADGGLLAEPLERPDRLARAATLTVSCPSFPIGAPLPADYPADWFATGLGAELEHTHPVLPFAIRVAERVPAALVALASRAPMVTVRDTESRDRLRAEGVDRDIEVVAHPGLLLDRVVDLASLPARADQLRQLGVLPAGPYDVTDDFLPDDLVFEDRLAVLAAARMVTTSDEHVAAACAGLGVPCAGKHPPVSTLTTQLDRLAELAEQTLAARGGDLERRTATLVEENHALRTAHWQLRQRLLTERQRLVEPLAQAWQERDAAVGEAAKLRDRNVELTRRNEELTARLAHVEHELASWQNTKLVRWTRPLRDVYGKARG
jgi:regulator of replication initiation timing